ncbi:MAG: CBS domain-containing protein [Proteobacteria bacterium]|nr:CBS domain-containing protein [Pseudomonadota bacterium]
MSTQMTDTTNQTIEHILMPRDRIPVMGPRTILKEALELMGEHRLGMACIVDEDDKLIGIFTDGDLRRLLLRSQKPLSALFADDIIRHARTEFSTVRNDVSIAEATRLLEVREIWDLPVVDENEHLIGLVHLHPALRALMAG